MARRVVRNRARLKAGDLKAISFHADVRVGILSLAEVRPLATR